MTLFDKKKLYFILVFLFALDAVYWYGGKKDIELITDLKTLFFFIPFIGFVSSYFLLHKTDIKHKAILNIVITIGTLINLGLIFLWYILKDFGF